MVDTSKLKGEIVKALFYLNLAFLIGLIFAPTKSLFIIITIINIFLSGTVLIIDNFAERFMMQFEKMWVFHYVD